MKTPIERLQKFTQKVTVALWLILFLLFIVLWNNSAKSQPSVADLCSAALTIK